MAKPWNEMGRYGGVGIELVLAILICAGIGHWLDQRYWPGHDWGMLVGFLFGLAVGIRTLVKTAQRMQRDIERAEARDPEGSRWTVDETWLNKPDEPTKGEAPQAKDTDDDRPN